MNPINYRGPRARAPIDQDQYITRIDHRISDNETRCNGSYMYNIQTDDTVPTFSCDTRGNTGAVTECQPERYARFLAQYRE